MLEEFKRGYFEAVRWTEEDEIGKAPFSIEFTTKSARDCSKFYATAISLKMLREGDAYKAGVDFWLTRNKTGAGFWDGDWPELEGSYLTGLSDSFGQVELYVGDNGLVYL